LVPQRLNPRSLRPPKNKRKKPGIIAAIIAGQEEYLRLTASRPRTRKITADGRPAIYGLILMMI
jgi:hypothetical protein